MGTRRLWALVSGLLLLLVMFGTTAAQADNALLRWDIVSIDFTASPPTLSSGGTAFAQANDGSKIAITGSGTFRSNPGRPQAVTGGGTWTTFSPGGSVTESGTYQVIGFVDFVEAPGTPPGLNNTIGDPADVRAGLVTLRVAYSNGKGGVLVVSCRLVGTPSSVFEGVSASMGFVSYTHNQEPSPGIDANRTVFHVLR